MRQQYIVTWELKDNDHQGESLPLDFDEAVDYLIGKVTALEGKFNWIQIESAGDE